MEARPGLWDMTYKKAEYITIRSRHLWTIVQYSLCILVCRYYIIMISIIHIYIYCYQFLMPVRPQTSYCVSIGWKRLHGTLVIFPSPHHRNCSASQFSRGGPEPKGGGQEHEAKAREADRQQLCLPKSWGAVHTLHSSAFWLLAPYGIALSQKHQAWNRLRTWAATVIRLKKYLIQWQVGTIG